uniref:Uncharacterized protein n=1 Tax=Arundo donax TaxID=35708 RepID=A0A0A9EGB7_ARUDO
MWLKCAFTAFRSFCCSNEQEPKKLQDKLCCR